jgi:hypothetical protein
MGDFVRIDAIRVVGSQLQGLRADPDGRENFAMAQTKRFILREEGNFVEVVDGTYGVPSAIPAKP